MQTDDRVRIDDRVREVHLSHYCPGGASLPETSSRPIGLDVESAAGPPPALDPAAARAGGQPCGRCGRPIAPSQDVRRRAGAAGGAWVHETCPPG